MKKAYIITGACMGGAFLAALIVAFIYLGSCFSKSGEKTYLYIYKGDTPSAVKVNLHDAGVRTCGFTLLCKVVGYKVRAGRYAVMPGENLLTLFRRLRNGQQEAVNLTIPSLRTMDRLAGYLSNHLMLDSTEVAQAFSDGDFTQRFGYTPQSLPALFIPNTYQVYWTTSLDELMERMKRENAAFWNEERTAKAKTAGLTKEEVMTLASIVDEETANNGEKPMIAGMYMKRLSIGMPLQADPTVKFAVGDFSLRRIYQKHLTVESPYNTYKHTGLPPGPIRIPSIAGIDAVLNYVHHDYLFMCAKEDFSGTHNFARTYQEHLKNARKYTQALNERGVH